MWPGQLPQQQLILDPNRGRKICTCGFWELETESLQRCGSEKQERYSQEGNQDSSWVTLRYRGERGVGGRAESWVGEKNIQRKREGELGTSLGNYSCWGENTVTDTLVHWPASGDISHYFSLLYALHSTQAQTHTLTCTHVQTSWETGILSNVTRLLAAGSQ